ncbi:MAG: T9SS type A sorting domain-containing protein [Candidatus Marinimicrobia bacterium]|nr:T9SS type A sorting domain-containing protein [Candidatus Neomarinimicrobiota bacterium]
MTKFTLSNYCLNLPIIPTPLPKASLWDNPTTNIEFPLPTSEFVTLTVYDVLARKVETILNQHLDAGTHSVHWNARNVPKGIYFVRTIRGEYTQTRKMVLLK